MRIYAIVMRTETMPQPVHEILAALAGPTRLKIVTILAEGAEHCACELTPKLGVTQSRVSRHLSVLKAAGLVAARRDRQWVRYRLNPDMPPQTRAVLDAVLAALETDEEEMVA